VDSQLHIAARGNIRLAVDDDRAQAVAEVAAGAGLRLILNLTGKLLVRPRGATVENVSPLQGLVSLLLSSPASPAMES